MSTLSCDNIVKDYPGTRALDHVSASFDSGKINALLGKNGSGKSTLCKIFAGAESATSGEFYLDGQKLSFRNPTDAAKSGIVLVYQETSLVPTLTVMENIFMGRLPKKPGGLINWKLVQSETERLLKVMDVKINPKSKIMHLPMWQRQVVEICKALSQDPKVLILDEPTSALAKAEVEKLFAAIRKVKENDVIIIYISHKLAEIHEIADTVTVLRDAQYVGKKNIEEIDNAGLTIWQYFAVVPDFRATGVREGKRAYDWPCIIRCINTVDVMTAEVPELDWALLKRITARITAEVPRICRVCYDLTPKPVGTVEWE